MRYRFYRAADRQQDDIWRDTASRWGEGAAELYIRGLHAHLEKLAVSPRHWRHLPPNLGFPKDVEQGVFVSRYRRHYIFFRLLNDDVLGIIALLHERMDVLPRLLQDLKLAAKERD